MKRASSLLAVALAVMLTIGMASSVASACYDYIGGWSSNDLSFSCHLTGSDANYCYYDCYCNGGFYECDDFMSLFGLSSY